MDSYKKLRGKLAELFQLDQADLDFGIYRIMNSRRDDIMQFLDHDLLPQVKAAFNQYRSADRATLKQRLDEAEQQARVLGMDPDAVPRVSELRGEYATSTVDITALENDVYDHLYTFFSRYYQDGDFISLRRYKEGVYAIPYEGEEVKLYWANQDQYYIKTTEAFRDYAFKTPDGRRVHFKIAAADTEKDNVQPANGGERRFMLAEDEPVREEDGELVIRFTYAPDPDRRSQNTINEAIAQCVTALLGSAAFISWLSHLEASWTRSDGTKSEDSILVKHLSDYTKRNTFDYFIHKDLGGFLRRELDFYIKNEVMRLDDIESESAPRVEQYLSKVKVIRIIAHKIIDFVAQIEDFQKKLWLKKKFVVETNYCVTLDRVPEALYPEIAANEAQREEWVRLFGIEDEDATSSATTARSSTLSMGFLKANRFMMVDTQFFARDFQTRLVTSIDDLDEQCSALLVHSENFQALAMFQERYRGRLRFVYADPPYNTELDRQTAAFAYKDNYASSTWATLVANRFALVTGLLSPEGSLFVSIDDNELSRLRHLLDELLGSGNLISVIAVKSRDSVSSDHKVSLNHNYLVVYARQMRSCRFGGFPLDESDYSNPDNDPRGPWKPVPLDANKPGGDTKYGIENPNTGAFHFPPNGRSWAINRDTYHALLLDNRISFGSRGESAPKRKMFYLERLARGDRNTPISIWADCETTQKGTEQVMDLFGGKVFAYPKPVGLMRDAVQISNLDTDIEVMDFFAGSGTTGHAVIDLNRMDGGKRKYILVEMGDHFDTVLLPRMKKVVYSKDWRDGKPISREGISHMFKYLRLESYEDALANTEMSRTQPQQALLEEHAEFRESYLLKYLLENESRGSQSLLNTENFDDPWNYRLLVSTGSVGETRPVSVDLVETFNWLLGLRVHHIDTLQSYRVVTGTSPRGERVLVIWRQVRDLSVTDPEAIAAARHQSNRDLESFFRKQQYNTLDSEFDIIYVNGDNNLLNVPLAPADEDAEPRYKVRLIEEEFARLMFDVKDV